MVDVALFNYIKAQLASGKSASEVKRFLLSQGHTEVAIDECLKQIYSPINSSKPTVANNSHKFITIVVIILLMISLFLLVFIQLTKQEKLPDDTNFTFEIAIDKITFAPSEQIEFHSIVKGNNPDKAFPITLSYEVRSESGNLIYSNTDDYDVQLNDNRLVQFQLPRYIEGRYYINAVAKSGKLSIKQTGSFIILEKQTTTTPTCYDGIKNQGETQVDCGGPCRACIKQCPIFIDDKDACTLDVCSPETNFEPVHEPIIPCCGNSLCENDEDVSCPDDCSAIVTDPTQINQDYNATVVYLDETLSMEENLQKIRELSKTDFDAAMKICKGIKIVIFSDQCIANLAEESGNPNVCKSILDQKTGDKCFSKLASRNSNPDLCQNLVSDLRRDSCYMGFALKGDYLVCDKIQDQYYKETCNEVKDLAAKNPEAAAEFAKNYASGGE